MAEIDWAAVGGGLGSLIWVDLLRICGVKTDRIAVLGMEEQPYARYRRLCLNSQIPLRERLRSNSDSCPDNIWGWPPYARAGSLAGIAQRAVGSIAEVDVAGVCRTDFCRNLYASRGECF